jgi:serine phosphatase RsbU (regulator of sigma subunit)
LIDRRFFRDAYDAQQILTELGSSLRATTNVNEVLELTTAQIQQALYAANVTIFLRNGQHDFQSAVSSDYHEREKSSRTMTRDLHLPDEAFVVQRIHNSSQPAEIDWDDPYSSVATQLAAMANGDAAAQQEFDTLRELKTNLVLPLAAKDELLGVLALGPRAGDLPYSREDKRMLMNVAGQTAMALENSRLIEQKIDLEAENERRAHELEEARQLQLSMLPKKLPQLPHLDIAAVMKTATEVGGDYYDFHVSDDGTLTIAVGDATGHGLRAGMIVTATKSLFNELVREPDLPELLQRCSRALKAMNLRGLFMALTLVRINGNRLTISSAGMPAALLYRAAEQRVEELLFKSMPLGSITNYVYKQQEATIAAGDVLVLLSDGLPERFNAQGEMLGDDAAVRVLCETAQLSPSEIIRRLVQLGEDWGGVRLQDDDATFVVVKVA